MFNRDGLFGRKDETGRAEPRTDLRGTVNVTPGLGTNPLQQRPQPQPAVDSPRPDLRFAEPAAPKTAPATRPEETAGSKLIVGPDIKLRGVEITDCDTLVVEGRVEASMDSRVIQIAENGVFSGTVSIDVAEIHGRFEGELTARKQLVIHTTGRVSGRIRYGTIRIEEGGEVSGEISTLSAAANTVAANPLPGATLASPAASAPPSAPITPAPAATTPTTTTLPLASQRPAAQPMTAPLPEIQATPVVNAPPPQASRPAKNSGKAGAGINTA